MLHLPFSKLPPDESISRTGLLSYLLSFQNAGMTEIAHADKHYNILSIDGCGYRALCVIHMLSHILEASSNNDSDSDTSSPRPCEQFDMICGTSVGGLLAIFFGRLQMTCDEARETYEQLCMELFEDNYHTSRVRIAADGRAKFAAKLEMIIDKRIKEMEHSNGTNPRMDKGSLCTVSARSLIKQDCI
jgi:hypothetical protein